MIALDPPYLGTSRAAGNDPRGGTKRYRHEMLRAPEHRELLDALLGCKAAVVLSHRPAAASTGSSPQQGGVVMCSPMPDVDPDAADAPPACFRYPHCEAREACGWPACSEPADVGRAG